MIKLKPFIIENQYRISVQKALQKFPELIRNDIAGEFFSSPNITRQDFNYLMSTINTWEMVTNDVKDVSTSVIIKNPKNKPLLDRLPEDTISNINGKYGLNLSFSHEGHKNLRSVKNLRAYVKLDPKTSPPITVDTNGRVLMGMHRALASLLRGDKTIKAYVMREVEHK